MGGWRRRRGGNEREEVEGSNVGVKSYLGSVPTSCTGLQTRSFEQPTRGDFSSLVTIPRGREGNRNRYNRCKAALFARVLVGKSSSLPPPRSLLQPAVFINDPLQQG